MNQVADSRLPEGIARTEVSIATPILGSSGEEGEVLCKMVEETIPQAKFNQGRNDMLPFHNQPVSGVETSRDQPNTGGRASVGSPGWSREVELLYELRCAVCQSGHKAVLGSHSVWFAFYSFVG